MSLEDHGVITAIKPSREGWRYEQTYAGRLWRIPTTGSAGTGDKLVQAVAAFRAAQGIAPGDPVADVANYIKKVSPLNDKWKGRQIGQPRVRQVSPIIHDLRQWVDTTACRKPRFVSGVEANERALVCLACPQNIRWEVTGCESCNTEVERRSYLLRQSKEAQGEDALKACRLHKCHLPAAVHIDRDHLPQRHPEAPEACWMRGALSNNLEGFTSSTEGL
jgi:hypothetical protein